VDEKRKVIVNDKYYFGNLSSIIKATPRQTLHDYFQWRLIATWHGGVHKSLNAPLRRFNNRLLGRDPDALADRWRLCIAEVDAALGHILGGVFISRMFTKKDKQLGDQVIQDVKNVFAENLKTLDWMSASAKEVAARKGKAFFLRSSHLLSELIFASRQYHLEGWVSNQESQRRKAAGIEQLLRQPSCY
jgi:endothelin-converting enzyme